MCSKLIRKSLLIFLMAMMPFTAAGAAFATVENGENPERLVFVSSYDTDVYIERLVYEVFSRLNIEVSVTLTEMDSGVRGVNTGIYDGICSQLEGSEGVFNQLVAVPTETAKVKFYTVSMENDPSLYNSPEKLSGKKVGSLAGKTGIKKYLQEIDVNHIEKTSMTLLYESLRTGECDVLMITDASDKPIQQLVLPYDMRASGLLDTQSCFIYLNKKHTGLVDQINEELIEMEEDGSIARLKQMEPLVDRTEKSVLYISSFSSEMVWEQRLLQGISNVLNPERDIMFHNITLNAYRNTDATRLENAALSAITVDLLHSPPDAVIVSDDEALSFVINNYNFILSNETPLVFCGLNDVELFSIGQFHRYDRMISVAESIFARQTVEQMLKMFPDTKEIFVINDYSLTGRRWQSEIESQLKPMADDVKVTYNENLLFDELMSQVSALDDQTLILCGSYFLDKENRYSSQTEFQTILFREAPVPIFGMLDSSQGNGALGGKYTDAVLHGETAAKLLVKALHNEEIDERIKLDSEEDSRWIFDHKVMRQYGINKGKLPENAEILNGRPSLREADPMAFYGGIIFAVFGIIIIVLLSMFALALKRRNQKLTLAKDALNRAYFDLQQMIESIPLPIVLVYPEGKEFLFVNSSWRTLFAIPESMPMHKLPWNEGDVLSVRPIEIMLDEALAADDVFCCEWEFETYGGEQFSAVVYSKKIVYAGKECLAITHKDLREERTRERMLQQAAEKEREASRLKSHFLMNMSHEIRTPMNAIIGITQLAKPSDPSEKMYESILQIRQSASVLLNIINHVLDLSMIEDGKMVLKEEEVRLSGILEDVDAVVAVESGKNKLARKVNMEGIVHDRIKVDASRLQQVVLALADNAVKFTPEGGTVSLLVREIESTEETATFLFEVEDTGAGIEPERMNRLFKPFEQADGSITRSHGGAGLGLSVAKNIVELMDGEIWAFSEVGKGSKFSFTIKVPILPDQASKEEMASERELDFTSLRILLVDDIDINRMVAAELLGEVGIATEEAENGRQAVDMFAAAESGYYDLIFMDVQMPILDGCSATREIRALDRPDAADFPIVAMTANVMPDDIELIMGAGMNGYVGKPILIEKVLEIIKEHVKKR